MANVTAGRPLASAAPGLRWGRIVGGAIAIEVLLIVVAIPLFALLDNPFIEGAGNADGNYTTIFVAIAVACLLIGALCGRWVARPLSSQFALHGALTGIVATAMYLAIASIPPNTIAAVYAAYGPFWFITANGLRIVGSLLGAALSRR